MKNGIFLSAFSALLLAACGSSPEEHFATADAAMVENDYQAARVALLAGLQDDPTRHDKRIALARVLTDLGDGLGAASQLDRLPSDLRESEEVLELRAETEILRGRYREALRLANKLELGPAALLKARAYIALGEGNEARSVFASAASDKSPNSDLLAEYALFELREDNSERALELLKRAQVADPDSLVVLLAAGEIASSTGDNRSALDAFSHAAKIYPSSVQARLAHASALGAVGQTEAAREIAEDLAPGGQSASEAALILARSAAEQEDWAQVRQLLQPYSGTGSSDHRILYANALIEQGLTGLALAELAPLRTRAPDNRAIRRLLAEAKVREGLLVQALEDLEWLARQPEATQIDRDRLALARRELGDSQAGD